MRWAAPTVGWNMSPWMALSNRNPNISQQCYKYATVELRFYYCTRSILNAAVHRLIISPYCMIANCVSQRLSTWVYMSQSMSVSNSLLGWLERTCWKKLHPGAQVCKWFGMAEYSARACLREELLWSAARPAACIFAFEWVLQSDRFIMFHPFTIVELHNIHIIIITNYFSIYRYNHIHITSGPAVGVTTLGSAEVARWPSRRIFGLMSTHNSFIKF